MTVEELRKSLGQFPATAPVEILAGGIRYPLPDVFWVDLYADQGVVLLGDDPR